MTKLKLSGDFSYRVVDDEAFILNVSSGDYFRLNSTATALFTAICEGASSEDAVDLFTNHFKSDEQAASGDAIELIDSLIQRKVLVPDESGG